MKKFFGLILLLIYLCVGNLFLHTFAMDVITQPDMIDCHVTTSASSEFETTEQCWEHCFGSFDEFSLLSITQKKTVHQIPVIHGTHSECWGYNHGTVSFSAPLAEESWRNPFPGGCAYTKTIKKLE